MSKGESAIIGVTDNEGLSKSISALSLTELRQVMARIIDTNPNSGQLWDILTCLRGPDSPSERPDMTSKESNEAYAGRRARKYKTVEVIRQKAFFGSIGGAARHHAADRVTLPPSSQWDHFDKHVARAASALGIQVEEEGK